MATMLTSPTSEFLLFWVQRGPYIQIESQHICYLATSLQSIHARINGFWHLGDTRLVVNVRWICISLFSFIDLVYTVDRQRQRALIGSLCA